MGLRFALARGAGSLLTRLLKNGLGRPAANFPGKAALVVDPQLISHLRPRLRKGSIVVTGTNGKTTVTNLLADALERSGFEVACNRTGANLDSGVATALLQAGAADWGVLECDELWFAKVVPQLKPDYVVLLDLFRDQLDRMGEIEHMQESIGRALAASPATTLLYNCDDPLCQAVASSVDNQLVPFGINEGLGLAENQVADAGLCQRCDEPLLYSWRQYGQLGAYRCPRCGFTRAEPAVGAHDVALSSTGTALTVRGAAGMVHVKSGLVGAYSAYNLLAACAAALCCGVPAEALADAIQSFAPGNGRQQHYLVDGCDIMLNLAKNPTGFNQNLRVAQGFSGPKAIAFFVNDREADGHDVSWLWDVDFQELAGTETAVYAGGLRGNDVQVRLKYAGIDAALVRSAADFVARAHAADPDARLFVVANYTALPSVKAELDGMEHLPAPAAADAMPAPHRAGGAPSTANGPLEGEKIVIAHLYPDLLNLYGDGGNVTVLRERARARGARVEVVRVNAGDKLDLSGVDIVFLGGGPDRKQRKACGLLLEQAGELEAFVKDDGVLLAICGGFQILGRTWVLGDENVEGLGILNVETKRGEGGSHNRLTGNVVLESPLARTPVVGYENHAGRTFLGLGCPPFGHVAGGAGRGNNGRDGTDGALCRNVVGTYLHGPLLAKNPEVADELLRRAFTRQARKKNRPAPALPPLDSTVELAANEHVRARFARLR